MLIKVTARIGSHDWFMEKAFPCQDVVILVLELHPFIWFTSYNFTYAVYFLSTVRKNNSIQATAIIQFAIG